MQTEPNLLSLFRQLSFARLWLSASRRRPLVISRSAEDTCTLCSRLIGKFVARSNNRPNCLSNTYFIKPLRCNNAAKVLLFPETATTSCAKRFAIRAKSSFFDCLLVAFPCDGCLWVYNEDFIVGQAIEVIDEEVDLLLEDRSIIRYRFLF